MRTAQGLVAAVFIVLWGGGAAWGQVTPTAVTLWVGKGSGSGSVATPNDCSFSSGPGASQQQPLAGGTYDGRARDGLAYALACVRSGLWNDRPVEIYLLCKDGPKVREDGTEASDGTYCGYSNSTDSASEYDFGREAEEGVWPQPRRISGIPEQSNLVLNRKSIVIGPRWTIEGIRFSGGRVSGSSSGRGTFLSIVGSEVTLKNNWIGNTDSNCITVGRQNAEGTQLYSRPHNVVIRNNTITSCRDDPPLDDKDRHCVLNYHSNNVQVLYNYISECLGDAYQTENLDPTKTFTESYPQFFTVASNTVIRGNRMWATSYGSGAACRTIGENAVDIKRTGSGLKIQDNLMYGYMATKATADTIPCRGTGTASNGEAIVLHGTVEVEPVTPSADNPVCTEAQRDLGTCVVVEGNDVSVSNFGIAVGSHPDLGRVPSGVVVRGNFVHELRDKNDPFDPRLDPNPYLSPGDRGQGLRLVQPNDKLGGGARNLVYRNTLANIPGRSVFMKSYDATVGAEDSRAFVLANNLIINTGSNLDSTGGTYCTGPKDDSPDGLIEIGTIRVNALLGGSHVAGDPAVKASLWKLPDYVQGGASGNNCGIPPSLMRDRLAREAQLALALAPGALASLVA